MYIRQILVAGLIAFSINSQPARAELTVEDVWNDLSFYAAIFGGELSGDVSKSVAGLTVSNIRVGFQVNESNAAVLELGDLQIIGLDDGRVQLIYPEDQVVIVQDVGAETSASSSIRIVRRDHHVIATGCPGNVTYETKAEELGFELLGDPRQHKEGNTVETGLKFLSQGFAGTTQVNMQNGVELRHSASHDAISYYVSSQQESDADISLLIAAKDATSSYTLSNPKESIEWSDFVSALKEGLSLQFGFGFGPSTTEVTFEEPETEEIRFNMESRSGQVKYSMAKNGWGYSVSSQGITFSVPDVEDTVIPVAGTIEHLELDTLVPMFSSDSLQGLVLKGNVTNLTLADDFWDEFDPTRTLVRDGLSLQFDTTMQMTVSKGLLETAPPEDGQEAELPSMLPVDLDIVSVSAYALGAVFSGSGSFSFDNSDTETFAGVPAPTGSSNFTLVGAHPVIDALVELNALTTEEALGARAFLALLTAPTDTPDTLTSQIEIDGKSGAVIANGVRIH